jgi:hypothetical protein
MFSLLLVTAMSAVADTPTNAPQAAPKVANRAYAPARSNSYYEPMNYYSYSPPAGGFGGGCQYCPTDDVDLFLPCIPPAVCPVCPVRPVGAPRVNVYTPPLPIRTCPRYTPPCP